MFLSSIKYLKRALAPISLVKWRVIMQSCYLLLQFASWLVGTNVLAQITNLAISGATWTELWHAAIPMILIMGSTLTLLAFHVRYSTSAIIRVNIMAYFNVQILEQLLAGDDSLLLHSGIGKRLTILQNGIQDWANYIVTFMGNIVCNSIFFMSIMVFIAVRNPGMIPAAILYIVLTGMLVVLNQRALRPIRDYRRKNVEEFYRRFARSVMEKSTVVFSGAIKHELDYIWTQGQKIVTDTVDLEKKSTVTFWGTRYLLDIARLVVTLWIGYDIIHGSATAGDILAIGLLFGLLSGAFQQILDGYQSMSELTVNIERLWSFMDALPKMKRLSEGNDFVPKNWKVVLRNITYAYPGTNHPVFSDFSLCFEGGKKTAIVGRSGSGKSTLVKIILGLLEPQSGNILIDDQDLLGVRLDSYFPHVGYLAQEPSIFDGTVRENLVYGMLNVPSDNRLYGALTHARCDFVADMKLGLDTEIGERGVRLSGGERQRLAIARIFLRNPEILILDEPTSALDSFSEAAITEALKELFKNKTVVVAHRLQTVKEADTIFVLKSGSIIEQGTHDSLLMLDGEYAHMVDLQSGNMIDDAE